MLPTRPCCKKCYKKFGVVLYKREKVLRISQNLAIIRRTFGATDPIRTDDLLITSGHVFALNYRIYGNLTNNLRHLLSHRNSFQSPSYHGVVHHLQELHRAGAAGERVHGHHAHRVRVDFPRQLRSPANNALNGFPLAVLRLCNGLVNFLLNRLQPVFLLADAYDTLP